MPKIEVSYASLNRLLGKTYSMQDLETVFPAGKAELDEPVNADGIVKIELNDTNRPDLWSVAGLARLIKTYESGKVPGYSFFSRHGEVKPAGDRKVVVDASVRDVRPFIAAFVADGKKVDDEGLKSLIQSQEKLCWNFGQKRKSIAMGIYRSDLMSFPVKYHAVKPDGLRFVPLGMSDSLTPAEILVKHPKGQEFGHILANQSVYPMLSDAKGKVLSFPPIINSNDLGAVQAGDSTLFVELTGTDLHSVLLAASIMACDMSDEGFSIQPVAIEYPTETVLGQKLVTPFYFQTPVQTNIAYIRKLLGENLSLDTIMQALKRMGNTITVSGDELSVHPAHYRNDFLHAVDIVEDVMIGRGMNSFEPLLPSAFTVGRLTDIELLSRRVKSLMVGLGYQEMIFNYLGSSKDFIWKMSPDLAERQSALKKGENLETVYGNPGLVQIMNPMSENYEFVRNSALPNLLGAESVSGNAPYPHQIFEVGKTASLDDKENYGSRTDTELCFLNAQSGADFNTINSQISALFFYLDREYKLVESEDSRFIAGRRADIVVGGKVIGVCGELHPGVLENWGITVPCAAAEIALNLLPA